MAHIKLQVYILRFFCIPYVQKMHICSLLKLSIVDTRIVAHKPALQTTLTSHYMLQSIRYKGFSLYTIPYTLNYR